MTTRTLVVLSAGIEMAAGVALIVIPGFIDRVLYRSWSAVHEE